MNISKNGIRVVEKGKSATQRKREPLEYALDEITFWRKEAGQVVTIVVPKMSSLRSALKSDGWRVLRWMKCQIKRC